MIRVHAFLVAAAALWGCDAKAYEVISGTSSNDIILLGDKYCSWGQIWIPYGPHKVVNGTQTSLTLSGYEEIEVSGLGGDDIIIAANANYSWIPLGSGCYLAPFADWWGGTIMTGGAGDDHLIGSDWDDRIYGSDGDDEINGNGGADILSGETGADYLDGGDGPDSIQGGEGGGTFLYPTFDELHGGAGDDILISNRTSSSWQCSDFINGDSCYGDDGDDIIWCNDPVGGAGTDTCGDNGFDCGYGDCEQGPDQMPGEIEDVCCGGQPCDTGCD